MWLKQQTYFEQPDVRFDGELLIAVMDAEGRSGVYSTIEAIGQLHEPWQYGVPFISMQRKTNHEINKLDSLKLSIDIPGMNPATVRNLQVFANFDYLLSEKLQIEMSGLLHVNLDTPNGVAKAIVYGDLEFEQAAPILIDSIRRDLYLDSPLSTEMFEKHGLVGMLEFYEARNDKLRFNYQHWI